ncbi:HD domain-containing protein [Sporotomaculum syntrophicum]|uniref:HD domain-containing protein n=1 Tax=Sporotomaculum syntrophicum TaxID=182264 RepID=UPI00137B5808|nr:HD domain-containing protein [Sporotomaculum syntrophicum]
MNNKLKLINDILNAAGSRGYIVGGWLRDKLLGRSPGDVDLVVEVAADVPEPEWPEVAHRLNGTLVVLDEQRGLYRLVLPAGDGKIQVDIDVVAGGTLNANLKKRDFTINAQALPLSAGLGGELDERQVVDPLGGLVDLRAGLIRACGTDAIASDPLRALRAFRFAAQLGFVIEQGTIDLIKHCRQPVTGCAGERQWDEFSAILELRSAPVFRWMEQETGLLEQIIPEIKPLKGLVQGGHHVEDAWEHSLKTLKQFEVLWSEQGLAVGNGAVPSHEKGAGEGLWAEILSGVPAEHIAGYLNGYITRVHTRVPVFKLACLLHDVGKQYTRRYEGNGKYTFYGHHQAGVPVVQSVAERLKMSAREKDILGVLVGGHMDPLFLYKAAPPTPVAVRRFFQRSGLEAPGLLLLSLADICSTRLAAGREEEAKAYAAFIQDMLLKYFNEYDMVVQPARLLNGNDVCALLGIKPSPQVRRVLELLADAQVEGKVKTRVEAEAFVRHMAAQTGFH